MDIRIATQEDVPTLAALAISFRGHLGREVPSDNQFYENVGRLLAGGDAEFLLGTVDGRGVGYVLLRYRHSMWAAGTEATLEDLFVDPGVRRKGLGRALVEAALGRVKARGCATVCLDTNEHNAASTAIYAGLGFDAFSRRWQGRQLFFRLNLGGA